MKQYILTKEKLIEDEAELAYLCGLIASDGCLLRKNRGISLQLQETDKKTVDWVASVLTENKKPSYVPSRTYGPYTGQPKWRIQFTVPIFYQYCLELGMTPAKSLTLDINLKDKSDKFLWYFFRGVLDGDGCIYYNRKNPAIGTTKMDIASSSLAFITTLKSVFGGCIYKSKKKSGDFTYRLTYKGNHFFSMLKHLPQDNWMMERKNTILKEIISLVKPNYASKTKILEGSIWERFEQFKSIQNIYQKYNSVVSFSTFMKRINAGWNVEAAALTPSMRPYRYLT